GLAMGVTIQAKPEFNRDYHGGYFAPSNAFPIMAEEQDFLTRGVLSWTSPHLDLAIGRDRVGYGDDVRGSIMPGSSLPYLDAIKGELRLGPARLDWMVANIESKQSWEARAFGSDYDVEPNLGVAPPTSLFGFETSDTPTAIYEMFHRISWDFGALRFELAENYIVARPSNRLVVTDLLPLSVWHNANEVPNNDTLYINATWKPSEDLKLAFQGGFDDINGEILGIPDSGNTIPAAVLGLTWAKDTGAGEFGLYTELGYTHYLWGSFSAHGQIGIKYDDPLARAIYRLDLDNGAGLIPLTSPYGPGALWFLASGGLELGGSGLRLGTELLVLGKNTEANLIATPYDKTIQDAPWELFASLKLPVRYRTGSIDLTASPDLCLRNRQLWLEAAFVLGYHFRAARVIDDRP
ncbi:MAG TPA: hypothetical protein VFL04_02540, partial [Rectinemataceae bacterium]|nr:hypothetical protein [Rectinemataceae bacterium]